MLFAREEDNVEHIAKHSVTPKEAEFVVRFASASWPEEKGEEKMLVWGLTRSRLVAEGLRLRMKS